MQGMSEGLLSRIDQAAASRHQKARDLQRAADKENADQRDHFERFKSLINEVSIPALREVKAAIIKNGYQAEITVDFVKIDAPDPRSPSSVRLEFTNDKKAFSSLNTSAFTIHRSPSSPEIRISGKAAKSIAPADTNTIATLQLTDLRDKDKLLDLATKFVAETFES